MLSSPFRRRLAGGAVALGAVLAISACMPADGTSQTIALAGSDTTQDVMSSLATQFNDDPDLNKDPDTVVNILSQQPSPISVPGDAHCATRVYGTPAPAGGHLAPNGSGAGRDALRSSVQNGDGCIDVARSSSPPRAIGQDLATFRYVAYALDAVGWSSASTQAPANLSLAQLRGIYNCTYTNWSQVGGTSGAIRRYWPQAGSGTRSFFQTEVLGFDPTTFSTGSCPAVTLTQENTGQEIAANGHTQSAVVPYSAANWVAAARGTQADQRAGQTIRRLNNQALITGSGANARLNTAGPVNEANVLLNNPTPAFPGIRYVFNVLDASTPKYDQANRLFGFINEADSPAKSPVCSGAKVGTIEAYGFAPLDTTSGSRNLSGSTCREFRP